MCVWKAVFMEKAGGWEGLLPGRTSARLSLVRRHGESQPEEQTGQGEDTRGRRS